MDKSKARGGVIVNTASVQGRQPPLPSVNIARNIGLVFLSFGILKILLKVS